MEWSILTDKDRNGLKTKNNNLNVGSLFSYGVIGVEINPGR